jgi:hypothetical protein
MRQNYSIFHHGFLQFGEQLGLIAGLDALLLDRRHFGLRLSARKYLMAFLLSHSVGSAIDVCKSNVLRKTRHVRRRPPTRTAKNRDLSTPDFGNTGGPIATLNLNLN